jgi:hypothetical protein
MMRVMSLRCEKVLVKWEQTLHALVVSDALLCRSKRNLGAQPWGGAALAQVLRMNQGV